MQNDSTIDEVIIQNLFNSLGFSNASEIELTGKKEEKYYHLGYSMLKTSQEIKRDLEFLESYRNISRLCLTTKFEGITPDITIKRIREATKKFDINNIYAIVETKPEEWNIDVLPKGRDPLIISVNNNKAYLIDNYYPTSLEDVVSREWTK